MTVRNMVIWAIIIAVMVALYVVVYPTSKSAPSNEISYSQLLQKVDQGEIKSVTLHGETAAAVDGQSRKYSVTTPSACRRRGSAPSRPRRSPRQCRA